MFHKSSTRKTPYNRRKKNEFSTWRNHPKTRQQKKDERITKSFVIKRIVDHLKYLGREKKRAPAEDKSFYDEEIDYYYLWKQEIENLSENNPLIFKEIFLHYKRKIKERNEEIERIREEKRQLRDEISINKARINELEDPIEKVKDKKNQEIEGLRNQIIRQIDAEAVDRPKVLQNIKYINIQKYHDLERENNEIKKKIETLEIDFERSQRINSRIITNLNIQYENLRERMTAYQIMLSEQGIMTIPNLKVQRQKI